MQCSLQYQWSSQATIQRVNQSLTNRGYRTWFDLINMKGSTVDAVKCVPGFAHTHMHTHTRPLCTCAWFGFRQQLCLLRPCWEAADVSSELFTFRTVCRPAQMSDAIDCAEVMLYGVSLAYKESANVSCSVVGSACRRVDRSAVCLSLFCALCPGTCSSQLTCDSRVSIWPRQCRLEANYGHQQELDMIPLMMTDGYSPKGWLGLILGTRLWYAMWEAENDDDAAFEQRMDPVRKRLT